MTWNKNILKNYQNLKESQHVTIANGNKVQIYGQDTTQILSKNMNNILCLPDFKSNLLSISKLTQDLNYNVIFSPNKVMFQDRISGKKTYEGYLENGL
jgi:hypothetical protein